MKKQSGFTLIEIVMVLVLLAILAAVAVPKFYDLRKEAEEKTIELYRAEFQSRLFAVFSEQMLSGKRTVESWEGAGACKASCINAWNAMIANHVKYPGSIYAKQNHYLEEMIINYDLMNGDAKTMDVVSHCEGTAAKIPFTLSTNPDLKATVEITNIACE